VPASEGQSKEVGHVGGHLRGRRIYVIDERESSEEVDEGENEDFLPSSSSELHSRITRR
jgi:hypothetical protein